MVAQILSFSRTKADRSEESRALHLVRNRYRANINFKYKLEATWYQTVLFTHGLQYVSFNLAAGKPFFVGSGDPKRVRVAYNVMLRMAEDHKSSFISTPYEWQVSSLTEDTEDILAARRADQIVRWHEKVLKCREKRLQLADWIVKCGNAIVHLGFDPTKGDDVELAMQDGKVLKLKTGEMFWEIDSPFRWYFHPHATSVTESPWAIRRTALPRSVVARMFPKFDIDQVPDIQTGEAQNFWEYSLLNFSAQHGYAVGGSESLDRGEGFIEVFQAWSRPGDDAEDSKNGDYFAALGNGGGPMYIAEEKPNQTKTIPAIHFGQIETPGRLWKDSWMTQIVSPQRALNRGISQMIENGNLTANPQCVVPDNGFAPQTLTNRVGGIVRQDPNAAWRPYYLQAPQMPQYVSENIERALGMMDVIAAPFGPSSSAMPKSGASSGVHLMRIQEQNQTKLVSQVEAWEAGHAECWNLFLDIYRTTAILPRRYEGGVEGKWMDFYMSGRQLTKRIEFAITPRSSMPKTPSTAFATSMEILKVVPWLSQDPKFMNHFWRDISYGDMIHTYRDRKEDSEKAYRNVTFCRQGLQPVPDEWDDPAIHMPIYESEMNTDSYRDDWEEPAKLRLYALWKMFQAFQLQGMMMKQMALQSMQGGGQGQPGMDGGDGGGGAPRPQANMTQGAMPMPNPFMNEGGRAGMDGSAPVVPGSIST